MFPEAVFLCRRRIGSFDSAIFVTFVVDDSNE